MTPTDEIRARLDELGVEYDASEDDTTIFYDVDGNRYTYNINPESGWAQLYGYNLTPEQAIAATVGVTEDEADARALTEAIRDDDGVRYSMDEVMKIMGKDVAARQVTALIDYGYSGDRLEVEK